MAAMRFSSVRGTGLVPGASRCRVAYNDVSAAHVSSHVGVASALAGMMPLWRTKYPPTKATTMVTKTPNTNPLNITIAPLIANPDYRVVERHKTMTWGTSEHRCARRGQRRRPTKDGRLGLHPVRPPSFWRLHRHFRPLKPLIALQRCNA